MKLISTLTPLSLSHFQAIHGEHIGQKKHAEHRLQARKNLITTDDYWIDKGAEKNQKAINEHNKNANKKAVEKLKGQSEYTCRSIKFWMRKGLTLEEAKHQVALIQNTNTEERYIQKHGSSGKEKYQERINAWLINFRNTMELNGLWVPKEKMEDLHKFYREIASETRKNYKLHKNLINPMDLPRGKRAFELDHKYSISQGFVDNIDPKIIGHWTNLEMLPAFDNCSKWRSCSISKDELLENYDLFTIKMQK